MEFEKKNHGALLILLNQINAKLFLIIMELRWCHFFKSQIADFTFLKPWRSQHFDYTLTYWTDWTFDLNVCSYPLFGVDDVFPQELLGNRRHVRRVGQNHFLQGHAPLSVARVMFDVGANHEACQHLILKMPQSQAREGSSESQIKILIEIKLSLRTHQERRSLILFS